MSNFSRREPEKEKEVFDAVNRSDYEPIGYKVLIKLENIEEKTESGIMLGTPIHLAREQMAQVKGYLVAVGDCAFDNLKFPVPVGTKVMISKYAGQSFKGDDGYLYRLCNDEDLGARQKAKDPV